MSERVSVGDIAAAFLQACGVDTAYGVVSIHNLPMLDAIARGNAVRFVTARGEAGAGHMADAHARVSGGLGALITSTGPGAANAAGALVEARFSGTPLLHLTGQTATGNIDREQGPVHDVPQQLQMLDSVSKSAYRVRSAESALGVLVRAAAEALTPPEGPVSVEIPIDIQRTKIPRPAALDTLRLPVPPPLPPAPAALDALAETVRAARRPLLWLGSGARGAGGPAARLAALGIPVVTSWKGRGALPEDHPMTLGGLNGTPEIEAFYDSLDLAIIAGSRLRGHETRDQTLRLPARRVQIDVDAAADGRTYASELFVCGDCALALAGLADRLDGAAFDPALPADTAAARAGATAAYKKSLGVYASWPDQLRGAMPRDAVFVRDITLNHTTWANRIFPIYGPRDSVYPTGAAIGPGLPLAIGAALGGGGRKTVAMTGDGGFWLSLAELWTLAQERAPAVVVVMNDGGYGVIKQIQDRMYGGRRHYADMPGPDIEGLARLAGLPWFKVSRADEFGATVARALEIGGPALVEADMAAIGPFPPYFVPPPYVAAESKGKSAG